MRRAESVPSDINNRIDHRAEIPLQFGTLPKAIIKRVSQSFSSGLLMVEESVEDICVCVCVYRSPPPLQTIWTPAVTRHQPPPLHLPPPHIYRRVTPQVWAPPLLRTPRRRRPGTTTAASVSQVHTHTSQPLRGCVVQWTVCWTARKKEWFKERLWVQVPAETMSRWMETLKTACLHFVPAHWKWLISKYLQFSGWIINWIML